MKVGLIVPGFSAHEQDWCIPALLDYVRTLARQAEVHVYTLRWPEREAAYAVFGAAVHALGGGQRMGLRVISLWARAMRAVAAEHGRAPFTALHAFWADEPGWVAAWAGRALRIPITISLAGGELVGLGDIGYGMKLLRGRGGMIRWALRQARYVTAGSHYLLKLAAPHVRRWEPARLLYAPLGVDTALFAPAVQESRPGGLLTAGALYPVKDHAMLLLALARVPGARLRIAGQGPLRASLEKLAIELGIAGRVEFLGEVDHACLPTVYQAADIYVQTSRHEAQGMAVLEAAACGLAVVGTPVGVLPEIGVTAPDEAAIAVAVEGLLHDAPRRKALGEAARQKVESEFSLAEAVARFGRLYKA